MSLFVVDASAGVKWVVPEAHSDAALRLQDPSHQLHAPGFVDVEVGNILWKKLRKGELSRTEADTAMKLFASFPVTRHPDGPIATAAFDLADKTQRTVYDCMYLALAVQLGGKMVTADEKLFNSLASTPWAAFMLLVKDVP